MSIPGLSDSRPRPQQVLIAPLTLARGRVHEFCGTARHRLTAMLLRESAGPVLWIHPGWQSDRLFPDGLRDLADPGRLILASARRPEDLLWAMEEGLRSGAVPLVVAELPAPPALTPVRRLHLAAEAGAGTARQAARTAPLGLILTPGTGGAAGVESRWGLSPCHAPGVMRWHLDRLRERAAPPTRWTLEQDRRGRLCLGVPQHGEMASSP